MSWTSPDDVTDSWIGPDAPTDDVLVQKWVDRAEREVRYRVPDLQARLDAEADLVPPVTDLLDMARDVVVAMVTRVFRNPEGIRTVNQSSGTGPFSESKSLTYGGDQPGGLGMTADEVARLSGTGSGGAFTIDMLPSDARIGWSPVRWMQL